MYNFLAVLLFLYTTLSESRFLTNSGCICALSKSTILTPNASATSVAGCSTKMDWTGINSTWCLTDQTVPCGTYKPLYGYADTCSAVSLTSTFTPPVILLPDQTSNIFYTGQILTIGWTSTNILNDEFLKLSYQGTGGLRTLTSGSGVNITTGSFSTRISDSANSLATNTSLLLSTTSPTLSLTLNPPITILQSKLINITVYDGEAKGVELAGYTKWGMLNAVTEYYDHHAPSRSNDARLDNAWFGMGNSMKDRAVALLTA